MVTNLFDQRQDISPVADPYADGGLRVWDDYQFRRRGIRGAGGRPERPPRPVLTPPVNVVLPLISGTTMSGYDLLSGEGTWTGTLPIAYGYQWFRTAATAPPVAPVNTVLPLISGVGMEGEDLLCPAGTWTGTAPITYAYQWFRHELSVPVIGVAPAVTGSTTVGSTLHCSTGTWGGDTPFTYAYQWKRGATNIGTGLPDYMTVPADVGFSIYCTVTATNALGVSSADSNLRGPIVEAGVATVLLDETGETLLDQFGGDLTI